MRAAQGRLDCLTAGMDGYVDKPLDRWVLNDETLRVLPHDVPAGPSRSGQPVRACAVQAPGPEGRNAAASRLSA